MHPMGLAKFKEGSQLSEEALGTKALAEFPSD